MRTDAVTQVAWPLRAKSICVVPGTLALRDLFEPPREGDLESRRHPGACG